jgi:hypothetical protein
MIGKGSNYWNNQIARCLRSSFIWHNAWRVHYTMDGLILVNSTKALIPHWRSTYYYHLSHSVEVWVYKPSKTTLKRWHCTSNEKNNLVTQQSTVNNQNTEDNLRILLRILSITKSSKSTTIVHHCDQATYVWSILETIRTRTSTDCRVVQGVTLSVRLRWFDIHIPRGYSCLWTQQYRIPGAEAFEHRHITIRGVGRRVIAWRGSLIFHLLRAGFWTRLDLGRSCRIGQEGEKK